MSWSIYLYCEGCRENVSEYQLTYNYRPIFVEAASALGQTFDGFDMLDGRGSVDGAKILMRFLAEIVKIPSRYKPLEPTNGWGTYEMLVASLARMVQCGLECTPCDSMTPLRWKVC